MKEPQVEVFHWNPRRPLRKGRLARWIPVRVRPNNFGDMLGPLIVDAARRRVGAGSTAIRDTQLLSVGSVMHFAHSGAVVWGTGVNGKVPENLHSNLDLDVRAVRGPRTLEFLRERGLDLPAVPLGDPALLLPQLFPSLTALRPAFGVTVVPNLNEPSRFRGERRTGRVLDPRRPVWECLTTIGRSEFVVGSSLHAIIVAEALGVPARLVIPHSESLFKYDDYFRATGRPSWQAASSVAEAISWGPEAPLAWDHEGLLGAFPADLWGPTHPSDGAR